MAGNGESQYGAASGDANAGGSSWGSAPPIMHSWCLQPDGPPASSVHSESRSRLVSADADADDDCGFDLNLGLSLGGGGKSSKLKSGREKEKELALDRDVFREKDTFRSEHGARRDGPNGEEALHGGVIFKPLKTEQGGGNPNASANRVQSFWQDLDRSGNEAKEKTAAAFSPRQVQSPISNQQNEHSQQAAAAVEPSNWAGVNSVAEDSKMFAQHMWLALQGKAAQPEHQRVPLSARDEASLIKELQGLPPQAVATAAAWARVVAQGGFPVQLLEAIKDGVDPAMAQGMALQQSMSMKSHSEAIPVASPAMSQQTAAPSGDLERSDSDVSKNMPTEQQQQQRQVAMIQQQELVEQQRKKELQTQKRQEARRKRKALLEGQKSKKTKKEDEKPGGSKSGSLDSPPNSLRRTSSLQQPTAAVSKENSLSAVSSPPDSQDAGGVSSVSVFRRPGSSSWLHNWEGSPQMPSGAVKTESEKMQHGADGRVESVEQMVEIRRALERTRDKNVEGAVQQQVDSSSESRKNGSPDVVQMQRIDLESSAGAAGRQGGMSRQEGSGLVPLPPGMVNGQIDPAWIQKIMEMQMSSHQLSAMMENNKEMAGKSGFPPLQKRGEKAHPAPKQEAAKRVGRGASESSSGGTESSGGQDEKSNSGGRIVPGDAEALSSPAAAGNGMNAAGDGRPNAVNTAMPSLANAVPMANMTFPPGNGFPMMPSPFPFPLPMPPGGAAGGVPFSMPFPFPYLMQFAPNPGAAGDGNPDQRGPPGMPSPFQIALPAGFNPPFQIQTPEGAAAWAASAAVVQPHATPPHSPPRHSASKTGPPGLSREDEKHAGGRGMKGNDHVRSRNAPGGGEASAQALVKANSLGSGAFNRLRLTGAPATTSPLGPQFGISRSKSDTVSLRREGAAGSAFAALVEPFPAPPHGQANSGGHGGAKASSAGGSTSRPEPGVGRGAPASSDDGGPSAAAASIHPGGSEAEAAVAHSTSAAEENVRRGQQPTGVWRQGSAPSFEGMGGHEASSLRPGVAPGMQFGGTGQAPELPWVTCNGTISGVLYRVEKGQVRIVCACHGRHMTPGEFVQHAGCGEIPNPEKAIVVGPFTVLSQQPAPAQA